MNNPAIWVKMNYEQHGYYRVLYDDENWLALIEQMKTNHNVFSAQVRKFTVIYTFL